ncbi:pollen-specific leucine-rich repeat extensin-like protein 4 [Pararge aegeria]|uniref:pollen-specific leucine-rich repeat extensin-like protein 4 n=1 Tax=Pararge aegeria TaxID=116150 RepID=UPI0019D2E6DF|nr:pollen-specific leucine-rich repeat extensin-like protein 4 [Pararge aegeria]
MADVMVPVNMQYAVPMCPPMYAQPPPVFPMPAPMPIIAQALCPIQMTENMLPSKTTNTSTTTKKPETIAVAVPLPMPIPMPVPVGVPVFTPQNFCQGPPPRPKNCPPCPPCVCNPSCTPSFFSYCSPCHMKCRCRKKDDAPEPLPNRPAQGPAYGMPIPMPPIMGPPPIVMVPYPTSIQVPKRQDRYRPKKERRPKCSSSDESTDSTSSSDSDYIRRRRHRKRKRYGGYRRSLRSSDGENELVKPMLSYIAKNGDVKFKTKINGDDVAELLGEKKALDNKYQTVHESAGEDVNKKPNVVVLSKNGGKRKRERYKQVLLRGGVSNHELGDGKKELIFKPPGDRKISNLSVSFLIS